MVFILANQRLKNGPDGMFEHSQLVGGTWEWAYAALCFSCGYFAYDQLDMLHYRLYSGLIPSILVHHLILLVCFTLALYRNVTINYLILTLVCEVCFPFRPLRKQCRCCSTMLSMKSTYHTAAFNISSCEESATDGWSSRCYERYCEDGMGS